MDKFNDTRIFKKNNYIPIKNINTLNLAEKKYFEYLNIQKTLDSTNILNNFRRDYLIPKNKIPNNKTLITWKNYYNNYK